METFLKRIAKRDTYTIGKFYIGNNYFCDILEDKVRDLNHDGDLDDPGETKVWGQTAIPCGRYKVILSYSPRFKKILPRLMNVKGFDGILMHGGNTAEDTHGCLLMGVNKVKGKVLDSQITLTRFLNFLEENKIKEFWITIKD